MVHHPDVGGHTGHQGGRGRAGETGGQGRSMGGQEGRRASNHKLDESHKDTLALLWEDSVALTLNKIIRE